jgi:hypothetical protein
MNVDGCDASSADRDLTAAWRGGLRICLLVEQMTAGEHHAGGGYIF